MRLRKQLKNWGLAIAVAIALAVGVTVYHTNAPQQVAANWSTKPSGGPPPGPPPGAPPVIHR